MKSGYDQFFKNAQKVATGESTKPVSLKIKPQMAEKLRTQIRSESNKKRKKNIPWKLVGYSVIGLVFALLGIQFHDQVENVVKHVEISVLGEALAENSPAPTVAPAKVAEPEKAEASAKKELSPDEINHFTKLNERKRELDAREEELNRMESELAAQKSDLEKRLDQLEQTRKHISSTLEDKVQTDDKKIDNLVQMYSNMKPQQAAKVFENMDEDLAVEILARMKRKPAAEVMNLVKPEKAQVFSEKYTGYKRK